MQLTVEIASLKEQLSAALKNHETLTTAHKALNEQLGALTAENAAAKEKITAHEAAIAGHVAEIADLKGKLSEAEKKAGLTQQQIDGAVVKTLAATGVPAIQHAAPAANTPEGQPTGGSPKRRLAAIFSGQLGE